MIERLLPPGAAWAEAFDDLADAPLLPGEEVIVANAVPTRRNEVATVRACARRALGGLGLPPVPILRGERGAPVWPAGVVGSMTHCAGYRAAVVARSAELRTVGIDAEPHAPLPEDVLEVIALPQEQARTAELSAEQPGVHWDRLLFSAKESVYKAWFPLTRRFLEFEEADITLAPDGTWTARLLVDGTTADGGELRGFNGRWLVQDDLLLTVIA
ncbi:4'-phosphopantetheinyl transferase superfamily protein [Kitasatospora sp. NPDC049258]|uniref:4'-phosphopantetheinyl transferase family protein n=1 Tax=Kitasatospora sp. NPDC049258 TaxID=3155394 RepID=UPI0034343A4F